MSKDSINVYLVEFEFLITFIISGFDTLEGTRGSPKENVR
jgi:hypothetical protein